MKKTVVTTVRARPVFRGAVSAIEGFMSSCASITDFVEPRIGEVWANPGTDSEFPAKCAGNSCQSLAGAAHGFHEQPRHQWRIELLHPSETFGGLRGLRLGGIMEVEDPRRQGFGALRLHQRRVRRHFG